MSLSSKFENYNKPKKKKTVKKKPTKPKSLTTPLKSLKPPRAPKKTPLKKIMKPPTSQSKSRKSNKTAESISGTIMDYVANSSDFKRTIIGITNRIMIELGLDDYKTSTRVSNKIMEKNFNNNIKKAKKDIKSMLLEELKEVLKANKLKPVDKKDLSKRQLEKLAQRTKKIAAMRKREK